MGQAFAEWLAGVAGVAAGIETGWADLLFSVVILAGFIAVALLFSKVIFRLLLRATRLSGGSLDDRIVRAARWPVTAYIILLGVYLAIAVPLTLPPAIADVAGRISSLVAVVISAVLINAVSGTVLRWVEEYLAGGGTGGAGSWALPMARRGIVIVVFAMAGMVSLDIVGINISPLIAGLGIGGLAVALALQPTLSNLFAGTYVITEGVVSAGDYIEMENGITGYVVDVNWRSTRLRTWTNNMVIIPNSRFAETIITNYSKPEEYVNVYLVCGVAYESDLGQVEAASMEVMRELERDHAGVVPGYGVYFGYDNFGESNIDFWLFMQARDRLASFEVRSELIKRLHARLTAEGIAINYPVRTLHFPAGSFPERMRPAAPDRPDGGATARPDIASNRASPVDIPPGAGGRDALHGDDPAGMDAG